MPNDLVRWPGLEDLFKFIFPNSSRDAMDNRINVPVKYKGATFVIRPWHHQIAVTDFDVYGPASIPAQ